MTIVNTDSGEEVRNARYCFAEVIASGVDPLFGNVQKLGTGMAVSQASGNLVVTTGTTAYSETIIRSTDAFEFIGKFRYGLTLSQRIVNNNFSIELVDIIGDDLPINVTSSTAATITKTNHGYTTKDVGKGIWVGALTVASCLTQRATIASITDDNNFVITVSGFTAGKGTCSLFGMYYHQIIYSGTTATSLGTGYVTQHRGWQNTAVNASISTTSSGHIGMIDLGNACDSSFMDMPFGTSTTNMAATRAMMNQMVPEGVPLYLQIRAYNDATNPASTTTLTISFIEFQLAHALPIRMIAMDNISVKNSMPIWVVNSFLGGTTSMAVQGAIAHDSANSGNPVRLGARALTSNYTAVATDDAADLVSTTVGALIIRPYSIPEAEWSYAAANSGIVNTTTAVTFKTAAGAGIRNYLSSLQIMAEVLTNATEVRIRDGAGGSTLWQTKIPTTGLLNGLNVTFRNPIKGTANTLMEIVTITASGAGAVYFNAQGYSAP